MELCPVGQMCFDDVKCVPNDVIECSEDRTSDPSIAEELRYLKLHCRVALHLERDPRGGPVLEAIEVA